MDLILKKIEIILLNTEKALTIRCNLSRLLQVIDNIIRNSVYWLRRSDSIFNIKIKKEIFIEFTNSGLIIWDTGIGIDKKVENNLFEMFVSAKPEDSNDGQGLGLFISQQLLRDEECDIRLLSERNTFGNMYKFFVDFSGIVL